MGNVVDMVFRGDFDKSLEVLKKEYERVRSQNKFLREQVENWNKDDEIQKARAVACEVRSKSLYNMTDSEAKARTEFMQKHYTSCGNGGEFLYGISHCGIGAVFTIKCPVCGEEKDITDYSVW